MGYREKRRAIRVGKSSRAVILPKPWLDYHGDKVDELTLLGDAVLIIAPRGYEDKAQRMLEAAEDKGNGPKNE